MWGGDRAYLFFVRTRRVEDVTFMRLGDGSVQMRWRNPSGVRFRAVPEDEILSHGGRYFTYWDAWLYVTEGVAPEDVPVPMQAGRVS